MAQVIEENTLQQINAKLRQAAKRGLIALGPVQVVGNATTRIYIATVDKPRPVVVERREKEGDQGQPGFVPGAGDSATPPASKRLASSRGRGRLPGRRPSSK